MSSRRNSKLVLFCCLQGYKYGKALARVQASERLSNWICAMPQKKILGAVGWLCAALVFASACTKSPFNDDVAPQPINISGQVDLHRSDRDNSNVYVWLEGINISTLTDRDGRFLLELPRERVSGATGVYQVYFFVANYTVSTKSIFLQNGEIQYGQGSLDASGQFNETIDLFKKLDVFTLVHPDSASSILAPPVDVLVSLHAVTDTVTVIFPKSVGGLLGGLFFLHKASNQVFVDIPDQGADTRETVFVTSEASTSRRGVFQFNTATVRDLFLPVGEYEVIPYFFIENIQLPDQLLQSLGEHILEPHPDFLNIPVKREGGGFFVF